MQMKMKMKMRMKMKGRSERKTETVQLNSKNLLFSFLLFVGPCLLAFGLFTLALLSVGEFSGKIFMRVFERLLVRRGVAGAEDPRVEEGLCG